VILGHAGLGLLGLAVWTIFMITGWTAFAWISVGLLAPVAGLGMTVLISGLPSPRPAGSPASAGAALAAPAAGHPQRPGAVVALAAPAAAAAPSSAARPGRQPVAAIAAHGLFVLATLLLVLLAAIGA
jgi:hypothetical protein